MRLMKKSVLNKINPGGGGGAKIARLGPSACAGEVFLRRRYSAHPAEKFLAIGHGAKKKRTLKRFSQK